MNLRPALAGNIVTMLRSCFHIVTVPHRLLHASAARHLDASTV